MGMTAVCSGGCGYSAPCDSHRGGRLGNCPDCGKPMRAHTAGKAKGRYICPISQTIVTLGITGIQINQPMRVAIEDHGPGRELGSWEREWLAAAEGRMYGPGCVVTEDLDPAPEPVLVDKGDPRPRPGYRTCRLDRERKTGLRTERGVQQQGRRHRADSNA